MSDYQTLPLSTERGEADEAAAELSQKQREEREKWQLSHKM